MLASYRLGAPRWLGRDAGIGAVWDSAEAAIEAFYRWRWGFWIQASGLWIMRK
jgi:hypothetical protein